MVKNTLRKISKKLETCKEKDYLAFETKKRVNSYQIECFSEVNDGTQFWLEALKDYYYKHILLGVIYSREDCETPDKAKPFLTNKEIIYFIVAKHKVEYVDDLTKKKAKQPTGITIIKGTRK